MESIIILIYMAFLNESNLFTKLRNTVISFVDIKNNLSVSKIYINKNSFAALKHQTSHAFPHNFLIRESSNSTLLRGNMTINASVPCPMVQIQRNFRKKKNSKKWNQQRLAKKILTYHSLANRKLFLNVKQ